MLGIYCKIFRTNIITNLSQKFLQVYILTILSISIQLDNSWKYYETMWTRYINR